MSANIGANATESSPSNSGSDSPDSLASTVSSLPSSPSVSSDLRQLSQTIRNSLQWINDFSPTNIFANFLSTNPFRRRNSKQTTVQNISDQKSYSFELSDRPMAHLLNGTLIPTAKSIEFIELANFGIVEIDDKERGVGHDFQLIEIVCGNWCDSCGQFLWSSMINNNSTNSLTNKEFGKYFRCSKCKYICHIKCRSLVRIDCQGVDETPYLFQPLSRSSSPLFNQSLLSKIEKYNEKRRMKGSGLGITVLDEGKGLFRGFLRVHLNLSRPINVISGRRPPSIYDIINEDESNPTLKRRTLTSFYMPRDTVKNIHITSESTSLHVIKAMLKKFKVVDNPQKFALYLRAKEPVTNVTVLKRIADHEKPLIIQLDSDEDKDDNHIVLQENDTGDVAWDAFEIPELNNFLKILEREEGEHLSEVILHYKLLKQTILKIIEFDNKSNQ